jgi:hypothetical protein
MRRVETMCEHDDDAELSCLMVLGSAIWLMIRIF